VDILAICSCFTLSFKITKNEDIVYTLIWINSALNLKDRK